MTVRVSPNSLQILHVDVEGIADSYKHIAKVSSDVADILVEFDEADRTCCRTAGPGRTPWYAQCDGSCAATPDLQRLSCASYCLAPLNQTEGWQAVKAVVNYVNEHMRSAGPQPVKPPGFPQTVRGRHFEAIHHSNSGDSAACKRMARQASHSNCALAACMLWLRSPT